VPSSIAPNLRDYGMTCDRDLLRIVQNLQQREGWARFSERVIRELFEQDTGHAPGVGTIPAALDRLAQDGTLYQIWMQKGGPVDVGYRMVRVAQNRGERRAFVVRRARHKGRREVATRVQRDPGLILEKLLAPKAPPAPAEPHARLIERRTEAARSALAELGARWEREPPS
jgi:hypothetical protein